MKTQRTLGALLLRALPGLACDEPRQAQQVVGGAAEDEDPVDVGQSSQFDLGNGPVCLSQPKVFWIRQRRLSEAE